MDLLRVGKSVILANPLVKYVKYEFSYRLNKQTMEETTFVNLVMHTKFDPQILKFNPFSGDSQTNISLLYTDSSKETDTTALASFLVPEFTGHWAKFALEVHEDSVVLYYRCTRFATRQVQD